MLVPRGFNYIFENVYSGLFSLISKIKSIYEAWGYEALIPPEVDFKSTFSLEEEKLFRFLDKFSGKTLTLRPDFTPQIKKYVLFLKENLYPLRYYYFGNIYKDEKSKRQNFVTGIEILGELGLEADGEVLSILHLILNITSKPFQVDIGHTLFLEGLFEELKKFLNPSQIIHLQNILKKKDFSLLEKFFEESNLDSKKKEVLNFILNAYGGKEVLKEARKFVLNKKMEKAISDLEKVYRVLEIYEIKDNLVFDLSEIRGLNYHKGIVFEVFINSYPFPVAKGGRYLVKETEKVWGVGFTLDLEAILQFVSLPEEKIKVYLIDNTEDKKLALKLATLLRKKGFIVARDIIKRDNKISLEIAKKKNLDFAVVLKENGFDIIVLNEKKNSENKLKEIEKVLTKILS